MSHSFLLSGQTDSGKSTIAGHLLCLVGYFEHQVATHDLPMYRKHLSTLETSRSKSKYSLLMDMIDGEVLTEKTKTQEFALIPFEWQDEKYTLIDTPGHFSLIRRMIAGLFELPTVPTFVLVLSSVDHEFQEAWAKGTSKENVLLGRSAGCAHLIVAWNKSDVRVTTTADLRAQVDQYVKPLRFKTVTHICVSGYQGEGLLSLLELVKQQPAPPVPRDISDNMTTSSLWLIQASFLVEHHPDLLVTPGFACVCHHQTGEYTMEIVKTSTQTRSVRLVNSSPVKCVVVLSPELSGHPGDRLIFRTALATVGFGVLMRASKKSD